MDKTDPWQAQVIDRFLREVGKSSASYEGLATQSISHVWVAPDARRVAIAVLENWEGAVAATASVSSRVRMLLSKGAMSHSEDAINWDSLARRLDRTNTSKNGDTYGSLQLTVALVCAAAVGVPAGLGSDGGTTINSLSDSDRALARDLWASTGSLATDRFGEHPPARPLQPRLRNWVRCPQSTGDFRLILIGEMPERKLEPVCFVHPVHQEGVWYAQEKPLVFKENVAFCAYVNLGNPVSIGFRELATAHTAGHLTAPFQPLTYHVKVYALRHGWEYDEPREYRKAFKEHELVDKLLEHGVKYCWPVAESWRPSDNPKEIQRKPPAIDVVTVSDAANTQKLLEIPTELHLSSPVKLSWAPSGDSYVEVRKALDHDSFVDRRLVSNCSVTLSTPVGLAQCEKGALILQLPGPDFYRVKLYPDRPRRFLDPLHELWIHIDDLH